MKILYLKGYKWLLSQNQQKRKTFLVIEDTRQSERTSVPGLLSDTTYFPLENVNKHGFFETLSPHSILLVPSFPPMKSAN